MKDIRHFQSLGGKVFLMADLNSRTAGKNDYIINDRPLQDHDEPSCHEIDLTLPRAARDRGSNRFGDNLLDLCKSLSMQIVNGRLGNDDGVGKIHMLYA